MTQWFHIGANIRSVLISKVAIFLMRLGHDLLESGGDGARVAGEAFRVRMAVKTTALVLPGNGRPVPFHKDRAAAEEAGARRREPVQATCTTESTQCFPGRPPRLLQSSPLF